MDFSIGINASLGFDSLIRTDPLQGFRFKVEIMGMLVGGFSEASGFQAETQTEEFREGGLNFFVHRLPKETRYQNLVLKRGITFSSALSDWHNDVISGTIVRQTVHVILLDTQGTETWCMSFKNAYPVKWICSEYKADSASVVVETLELAHNGFERSLWGIQ
jgi:phage tail-like protein